MDRRLYFLHRDEARSNHAGSKAVRDAEVIFMQMGISPLPIYSAGTAQGIKRKFLHGVQLSRLFTLPRGAVLFIQYPMYRLKRDYVDLLRRVKRLRKLRLVFLVHDLEMIRHAFPENPDLAVRDAEMFSAADRIIVHNDRMADFLANEHNVDRRKIICLGLFDYLIPKGHMKQADIYDKRSICIAGNLSPDKSGYIKGLVDLLPDDISLNLYGVNYDPGTAGSNVIYHGSFDADVLPDLLDSSFGLVWDGPVPDTCAGNMGNYMRFNDPHKVSLYISAGIPVIIWSEAALAGFVKERNIGFTVSSLREIPEKLRYITCEDYQTYKSNLYPLMRQVRNGYFLNEAVKAVIDPVDG